MFHVQRRRRWFIVFGLPKPSSKVLYKFYFHGIFMIYLVLFYLNDSFGLTKKMLFLHDFYVMAFYHCTGSQQSASRGRVLAFYGIARCLSCCSSLGLTSTGWTVTFNLELRLFSCCLTWESCHLVATRHMKLWSLNVNLFFKESQQFTNFPQ